MSETRVVAPSEQEILGSCLTNRSLHLVLLPTEACNFRCVYCYETFRAGRMEPGIVRGVKALLARRAPGLRDLAISWFGGEPLLARDVIEDVMEHVGWLAAANPELRVSSDATTNGYFLTPSVAARLFDRGVSRYQVTFDPPRERHDRLRVRTTGGGTFDRIWNHLLALRDLDRAFTITIRVHVDRDNAGDVPAFLDRCAAALGTDRRYELFIRGLSRLGGPNDDSIRTFDDPSEAETVFEELRAHARGRRLRTRAAAGAGRLCYAAKANSYVVRADGSLNKCTVSLDHPNNQVGWIHEDGTVAVDSTKLGPWMRGVWSGDPGARTCPMQGFADPPERPRASLAPTVAAACLALLLAAGAGGSAMASLGTALTPPDSSSAADRDARVPAPPSLEAVREWNQTGRVSDAEQGARALLMEAARIHGPESPVVAEILDELAISLRRGGKGLRPELLQVSERAVRIKERAYGRKDPRFAASLHNLGMTRFVRKEFALARTILLEVLEIQTGALGSNDPRIAKTLLALGAVHNELGALEEARPFTERGVAIEEIALGGENPERTRGLDALATLRYAMGDFAGAIPPLEEAIRLANRAAAPDSKALGAYYHNLGAIYLEIGDYPRAVELLERARLLREEDRDARDDLLPGTLVNLGFAYREMGEDLRAKRLLEKAIALFDDMDIESPLFGRALTRLGWIHLDEGDLFRAEQLFRRSLRIQENVPGTEQGGIWITLRGLARVAQARGEFNVARRDYERTVELLRSSSGPSHPDLGVTLAEYAALHLAAGDSGAAFETAIQAAEMTCENLRLAVAGLTERQALQLTAITNTGMDVACASLSGSLAARAPDLVRRLWDLLVRSRALVLDEIGGRARWVDGAGDLLEAARSLESARARLAHLLVGGLSANATEAERSRIARVRAEVDACERVLASRSSLFRSDVDRASIGIARVLANLPRGSALVSYARYGRRGARAYLALVAGPDREPRAVCLGSADEIDAAIAAWRTLAGTPPTGGRFELESAEAACRKAGETLRASIWEPLAASVDSAAMVFVVPDGPIHLVSLAALPARGAGYLAESPPVIHYVSAERDIVRGARVHEHGAGLLAVGNPAFDATEQSAFADTTVSVVARAPPPHPRAPSIAAYRDALAEDVDFRSVRFVALPETDREIDEIERAWGRARGVIVLKGARAGERSVKDLLPGRRVAHFATHGFFLQGAGGASEGASGGRPSLDARGIGGLSSETPDVSKPGHSAPPSGPAAAAPRANANPFHLSGIALAGANRRADAGPEDEDGILVAEEIASLDLSSLDWVVLSACQTGLGDIRSGEGVLGFRRAFEIAGAGTLITSLWAVEDESARDWMARLYDGRIRGMLETAEAVRGAHVGVLKSRRAQGRSTHPFFWAAFIAVGDWR